ncbi:MAG: GNAT family N-acetyltransferase [Clostridiales bacterium]|nr:GNAT family N-acetyltransferase [Clostridiales bacterium]
MMEKKVDVSTIPSVKPLTNDGKYATLILRQYKPTKANTKHFITFDWIKAAKEPWVEITAAVENGKVLGLIAIRFSNEDKANGALFIRLLERAGTDMYGKGGEHKGIGKRLIACAASEADSLGVDAVYLEPVTTAITYYRSLGFKPAGNRYMVLEGVAFEDIKEKQNGS